MKPSSFEREARAAAMMRHENIIQVIDCGRHDDVAYICMESARGHDLQKWIVRTARRRPRWRCSSARRGLNARTGTASSIALSSPRISCATPDGTIKIMDLGLRAPGSDGKCRA